MNLACGDWTTSCFVQTRTSVNISATYVHVEAVMKDEDSAEPVIAELQGKYENCNSDELACWLLL